MVKYYFFPDQCHAETEYLQIAIVQLPAVESIVNISTSWGVYTTDCDVTQVHTTLHILKYNHVPLRQCHELLQYT